MINGCLRVLKTFQEGFKPGGHQKVLIYKTLVEDSTSLVEC